MATMPPPPPPLPTCEEIPHEETYHNKKFPDPFHWLRFKQDPKVISQLEKENSYADSIMAETSELQERLFEEFVGRIKEDDQTAKFRRGGFWYYERTEKGKQYAIKCRRRIGGDGEEGEEEVLLDLNLREEKFLQLGAFEVSPDNKWLAYSLDTAGDEVHDVFVKNLESGELLPKVIKGTYYSLEWGNDNSTLFFDTLDEIHRPYRIFCQNIHEEKDEPVLIYEEKDLKFEVQLSKSVSGRFLIIKAESFLSTEVSVVDADAPQGFSTPKLIQQREKVLYDVEHSGDHFLIKTDGDGCDNFKVMAAPISDPSKENWVEIVPYDVSIHTERVIPFQKFIVLLQRYQGLRRLRVYPIIGGPKLIDPQQFHDVTFEEQVYGLSVSSEQYFKENVLRFTYSSFTTPDTVVDYDLEKRTRNVVKRKEVPGFNPDDYISHRLFATSHDGVKIPISFVHKKGIAKTGDVPTHLYGYGSYGISIDPSFSSQRVSYLDRGIVFAIGHIRGGGDNGRLWYKDGKFLKKKNTFLDFVACAEELIKAGFTNPSNLSIEGRSAGGLLIGATLNLRPDLFKVAFLGVPFVDVINTMMDASIPLTVNEYEEWGNPNEKDYFDAMIAYSPYDNLVPGVKMPHILIRAGLNDPRVQYWEPAKYVAKLRKIQDKDNENKLLLKTDMGAGHFGVTGRYSYLKEIAYDYSFIIHFLLKDRK